MRVRSYAGALLSSGGLVRGRSTWFPTPYRRLRPAPHPGDGENGSPATIPTAQGDCDFGFVGAKLPTLMGDLHTTLSAAGPGYSDCHRRQEGVKILPTHPGVAGAAPSVRMRSGSALPKPARISLRTPMRRPSSWRDAGAALGQGVRRRQGDQRENGG